MVADAMIAPEPFGGDRSPRSRPFVAIPNGSQRFCNAVAIEAAAVIARSVPHSAHVRSRFVDTCMSRSTRRADPPRTVPLDFRIAGFPVRASPPSEHSLSGSPICIAELPRIVSGSGIT